MVVTNMYFVVWCSCLSLGFILFSDGIEWVNCNKTGNVLYNVTLRRVRAITIAMEKR